MSTATLTASALTPLNKALEDRSAAEIIRWAHGVFGRRLAVLSAMQKAGCVLCEMVADLGLAREVDVVFVDTGLNFQETLDTVEQIRSRYGLNVVSLQPARTFEQQCKEEGVLYLWKQGQERCCDLRKKEPLKQIIGRYDALLGSLRRDEGSMRADVPVLAIDKAMSMVRVHPLFAMTTEEMEAHIKARGTVVNPLHEQGYPTISCNRCTTPVLPGEPERAGRWRHLAGESEYCAINPTDVRRPNAPEPSVNLESGLVERLLGSVGAV
ncbi:phosphoadenylyl-sulfate reductase [bacterium]|nr:phosphoadenylyl-sulfate reductase [bacterium]